MTKPTIEEIAEHFKLIGVTNPDAEATKFFWYYESVGWVVGKSKKTMVSWKAACQTWKRNITHNQKQAVRF